MTTLLRWWKTYGKAHVALAGGLATWAVATFPGTTFAHYCALALAFLTAAGVVVAPHKTKTKSTAPKMRTKPKAL